MTQPRTDLLNRQYAKQAPASMKEENKVDCTGKRWITPMHYRSENLESSLSGCRSEEREDSATLKMNEETFAVFYHSTVRPLWAYLSRVSGNPTLTDDLVQESYLRFLCARAPWQEGEIACRRYLFRIGTNLLRDQWRRPAGRSLEEIPEKKLPFVDPPNVEEMDSNKVLNAALLQLRPVERQLLWLAHAEEMSYREIVEITGLGMARIRLTLYRSRHKVARALRQEMMKAGIR